MKVIKVSDEAYEILEKISEETMTPISSIASKFIKDKDKQLYFKERVIKEIAER